MSKNEENFQNEENFLQILHLYIDFPYLLPHISVFLLILLFIFYIFHTVSNFFQYISKKNFLLRPNGGLLTPTPPCLRLLMLHDRSTTPRSPATPARHPTHNLKIWGS